MKDLAGQEIFVNAIYANKDGSFGPVQFRGVVNEDGSAIDIRSFKRHQAVRMNAGEFRLVYDAEIDACVQERSSGSADYLRLTAVAHDAKKLPVMHHPQHLTGEKFRLRRRALDHWNDLSASNLELEDDLRFYAQVYFYLEPFLPEIDKGFVDVTDAQVRCLDYLAAQQGSLQPSALASTC